MPNQFGPTFVYDTSTVIGAPTLIGNSITPAQLTANTNDWNPTGLSGATTIRVSTDVDGRDLTGIVGGQEGRLLILQNVGTKYIDLVFDATSAAANRFYIGASGAGGAFRLAKNQAVWLVYDSTVSRWQILSFWAGDYTNVPLAPTDNTGATGSSFFFAPQDHTHPSPEYAASLTYTPTLTQSVTVTKTVTYAHYYQIGKLVIAWIQLAITGAGTTNNAIRVGLPVTAVSINQDVIGTGIYDDTGTQTYPCIAEMATTSVFTLTRTDILSPAGAIGVNPNIAAASGDSIFAMIMYEAA